MILEAVWLKNGKEIFQVDPVLGLDSAEFGGLNSVRVYNGYYGYSAEDCDETPDDFIIRIKKEN